jgi:hypothetical protein
MLTIVAKSSRTKQRHLAAFLSCVALFLAQFLTIWQPEAISISLAIATGLLFVNTYYLPNKNTLIYLTHSVELITIGTVIEWWFFFPFLVGEEIWGSIILLLAIAEWIIYLRLIKVKNFPNKKIWQRSNWDLGLLLAGISYVRFLNSSDPAWGLVWLLTPLMLTIVAKYSRWKKRPIAACYSCAALVLWQFLTFNQSETRLISLAVATGLMFINTGYFRETITAALHIGFAVSLITTLLWKYISLWNWLVIIAIAIIILYLIRQYLLTNLNFLPFSTRRLIEGEVTKSKLRQKYAQAADYWAIALLIIEIQILTIVYLNFAFDNPYSIGINWQHLVSSILITSAIGFRYRQQPQKTVLYTFSWAVELSIFSLITLIGGNAIAIAAANIILALLSLWLINWLSSQSPISHLPSPFSPLHHLPIIYALLGIFWRLPYFTATTGFITLGAALIGIGIGSYPHRENKIISYLSLAAITFGIYELTIYQMMQTSGGSIADGFTILALVTGMIAITHRLFAWWWQKQQQESIFNFNLNTIIITAHIHWAIASILKIIAGGIAIESVSNPRLTPLSIAVSLCLGAYAIIQARDVTPAQLKTNSSQTNEWWVYVGLVEIAATIVYSRLIITQLSIFDPWRVIFTCLVALLIYQIHWQNLGWRSTPWQRTALVIPAFMALVTAESISYLSLLATAVFYLRIAYHQRNLRWSYVSIGFIDWCMIRYFWQYSPETIWFALIISLSCLYIAQFDPYIKSHRKQRHYLRVFASGLICLVALLLYQDTGIIPGTISIVMIVVGLGLQTRAFLFVGTITFISTIIYQLIIFVFTYSFLKWIVGLITGIIAIAIAANFEKKSDRLPNKLQDYLTQLKQWQ